MKTVKALTVILGLLIGAARPAYAAEPLWRVDGIVESLYLEPIERDGYVMMYTGDIFRMIGAEFKSVGSDRNMTASKGETVLKLKLGSAEAEVNGRKVRLPAAPVMHRDSVMVPLEFVCEVFGVTLEYGEDGGAALSTGAERAVMSDSGAYLPPDAVVLTYDAALKQAVASISTLRDLDESLEYLEELRKDTLEDYEAVFRLGMESEVTTLLRALDSIDATAENAPLNKQLLEESAEAALRNIVVNVANYEFDLQLLEENISLQERNVSNLELKLELGLAGANEVRAANLSLDQSRMDFGLLKISLENEREGLKNLLKMTTDKAVAVELEPDTAPVTIANLPGYIDAKQKEAPTVKLMERKVNEAKYELNTWSAAAGEYEKEKENAYNKATRDYGDALRTLANTIRTAYNNLLQLQEKQKSLELDLQKAKDSYGDVVASYEAGLVTMYDVDTLRLAILNAEIALQKNGYARWALAFGLEKPYLLTQETPAVK